MKIEELVRANLAQANYRIYLEKLKQKEVPPGEEDLHYLSCDVIDNNSRGINKDITAASSEAPPTLPQ